MGSTIKWPSLPPHQRPHRSHVAIALVGLVVVLFSGRGAAQQVGAQQAGVQQAGVLQDIAVLRAGIERFAAAPARIDARLVVPRCLSPALSWARPDVVRADCADPAWTLYVPVAVSSPGPAPVAARAKPAIRRGEFVLVEASGPGFAITMETQAERDADGSRVALKGPGGRRLQGRIEDGGRVVLAR